MFDVGCVLYRKGSEPGTLEAQWSHSGSGNGTGKATGGPTDGFAGSYHIVYSTELGNERSSFQLEIEKDGNYYNLLWITDGAVRFRGRGMEVKEGLAAGWCSANDK